MKNIFAIEIAKLIESKQSKTVSEDFQKRFEIFEKNCAFMGIDTDCIGNKIDELSIVMYFFSSLNIGVVSINSKFKSIVVKEKLDVLSRVYRKFYAQNTPQHVVVLDDNNVAMFDTLKRTVEFHNTESERVIKVPVEYFRANMFKIMKEPNYHGRFNKLYYDNVYIGVIAIRHDTNEVLIRFHGTNVMITNDLLNDFEGILNILG